MNISLFQAASAMNANARWQEAIAENMAASSVPGYKSQFVSFKTVEAGMMPAGSVAGASRTQWAMPQGTTMTSFAQGEMRHTGQPTDLAIQGKGFFEVQMPNGSPAYTRDGEFKLNANGNLVTKQGFVLMTNSGPLQMDRASVDPITVSKDGSVSQGQTVIGNLKIVAFNNPDKLTSITGGAYVAKDPNLEIATNSPSTISQGDLEQANTSTVTEMANLINVMRSSEANQRVIQMQDERMGKAITELGNPS